MPDKEKRKTNPRRRLLLRMLLGIAIIAALVPIVIKQFEPEHLYLVYKSYDEETLAPNLYLYDVTLDETVWQITDNQDATINLDFDTAENAPYLVYRLLNQEDIEPDTLTLVNLRSRNENILLEFDNGSYAYNLNISPEGQFVAYQQVDLSDGIVATYFINLRNNEHHTIQEFGYFEYQKHHPPISEFNWTTNSLLIMHQIANFEENLLIYEHNWDTNNTVSVGIPSIEAYLLPTFSPDGTMIAFPWSHPAVGDNIIISDASGESSYTLFTPDNPNWDGFIAAFPYRWNPNNIDLLIRVAFQATEDSEEQLSGNSYWHTGILNSITQEIHYISGDTRYTHLYRPIWNADGSYILYSRVDRRCTSPFSNECKETVIRDSNTEEIILPYLSQDIHWVRIP